MNDVARCPSCQAELPPDAPAGVCPKCLVAAGFHSEPPPTAVSPGAGGFVPPSPAELAPHFPDLEILELIGRGGMGAIYKARQPALDRIVALKILPPEVGRDPAFADRFLREARALGRLNHPNVVTIYGSGESAGLYYFLMEYVDGVNLRQTMRDGGVNAAQALAIIPQICDALQYAHEQGIVHRDIKPENILLDRKGRVKIADFGLSKLLGHEGPEPMLTQTHQVMGTLRYMAPEQMQGTKSVDHRADIYSLGVVFYELLTGEVPMGRFEPPSQRVQVDVRLDEVVLRSLEREPTKRYQHASEVKTDVEMISRDVRPFAPVAAALSTPATTPVVPDGVVFQRLTVFNVLFWLVWSALLATLQWGYLNEERWYFQKELPYTYLSGAWNIVSLMFAFFLSYWWYLLAKSPQTPRSFQDALRVMQTPDRRHLRLWIPLGALLVVWIAATVLTMSFYDDDVQSTTLTALFIVAPLLAMAGCHWAYRPRVSQLAQEHVAGVATRKGLSTGCVVALVLGLVFVIVAVPVVLAVGAIGLYWLVPVDSPQRSNAVPFAEGVESYSVPEKRILPKPDSVNEMSGEKTSETTARPSPERVARRAQALALLSYRGSLEEFARQEKYEALHAKLPEWIEKLGLATEFEPSELDLIRTPLGKADELVVIDAQWRDEGVAVLAWALNRFELPPYDQPVKAAEAGKSIGLSEEQLAGLDTSVAEKSIVDAKLRPAEEIDRYAVHTTLINWRLRSYDPNEDSTGSDRKGMNFAGYLRQHPSFQESWLNGLHLQDKDLTIGGVVLSQAKPEDVERCEAITVERQIAALWLRGDAATYSQVDPATILSDLGESLSTQPEPMSARLERIGHLDDGGDDPFISLAVQGKHACLIQGNVEKPKRLQVVELSEPAQPKIVGSHPVTVEAMRLAVSGDHVYVLDDPLLRVFDISKPSEPHEVGSCELGEHLWDIAVQGTFAYVTDVASVRVIDLKDSTMPREVGRCEVPDAQGITVAGNYAYIACNIEGMHVVDIARPETPREVGVFSEPAGAADVTIAGKHAFIVGGEDAVTLWIADISDPARPTRVCKYGDWIAGSVAIQGDLAFLAGGDLDILDVSNLANLATPRRVGGYADASFVTVAGDNVLVLGDAGMSVLRVVRE